MNEIVKSIVKHKVVVICHGLYDNELIKATRALYDGGIRVVEATFDQADPDAIGKICGIIRTIREHFPQTKVGSDTVTCARHVPTTKKAGGGSCLSPDMNAEVTRAAKEAGSIFIPGAMTPTEILQAHNAGADAVKILPVGWLGLSYLKDIKGLINHVKFPAATGVDEENFEEYLNAGCCAVGASGRFIDWKVIVGGNFEELTRRARIFIGIANAC